MHSADFPLSLHAWHASSMEMTVNMGRPVALSRILSNLVKKLVLDSSVEMPIRVVVPTANK